MTPESTAKPTGLEIAVIGMAGRFPGAKNIEEFWDNLIHGRDSATFFSDEYLEETGLERELIENPGYVRAKPALEDKDCFDAAFFGYSPAEAEVMAPHIRIFYECTWTALEDAAYNPLEYSGLIGCFVGAASSFIWQAYTFISGKHRNLGGWAAPLLSEKDFLSTRLAYKLNLRGPCMTISTACSTSLVAVHLACRALLTGECSLAVAGGVSVDTSGKPGYLYQEGMIHSSDGHCRTFDAGASGTIFGEGVGVVVLKRYRDAAADGDHVYALIKGSAVNNDGVGKVGFTAPGMQGQRDIVKLALKAAKIHPESLTYVEAHGTATVLGDPVEVEALIKAFETDKTQFCALGSVKSNVGHLEAAAGVASLIKTVLMLKYRLIPPSLHFEHPNPAVDFEHSPFFVNTELKEWPPSRQPRRAGVSSFGIGGTNAHVVLEESPEMAEAVEAVAPVDYELLIVSARTISALDQAARNLAAHLKGNPSLSLANVAYTLKTGRRVFRHRRFTVCKDIAEAAELLAVSGGSKVKTFSAEGENQAPAVVFMFPGLGAEYVGMGRELYDRIPFFRQTVDHCFALLDGLLDYNIREMLYPADPEKVRNPGLPGTDVAQLLLFVVEYALAELLIQWGIRPTALIGYSFGEYTAAVTAGVFSLPDALKLLVSRGELIAETERGGMLSVPLPEKELVPLLPPTLSLAIDNGPSCVVAGSRDELDKFDREMKGRKYLCMPVNTGHAIHSTLMDPIADTFTEKVSQVERHPPQLPYISNVTGTWMDKEQAVAPAYWSSHMRQTVRFADGVGVLADNLKEAIFLEVGPGRDLSSLLVRHLENQPQKKIVQLLPPADRTVSDHYFILNRLGRMWLYGLKPDWKNFYSGRARQRLSLPTYPFEGQRFLAKGDPFDIGRELFLRQPDSYRRRPVPHWFYLPSWKRVGRPYMQQDRRPTCWLLFADECGLSAGLSERLRQRGHTVVTVEAGTAFSCRDEQHFVINPSHVQDYEDLWGRLERAGRIPHQIIHLWNVNISDHKEPNVHRLARFQELGYYSLLNIARVAGNHSLKHEIRLTVVSNQLQEVDGGEELYPEKATLLGPVKVIPLEYKNLECRSIDLEFSGGGRPEIGLLLGQLEAELTAASPEPVVAYRGKHRWLPCFEPVEPETQAGQPVRLKKKGVYLIAGGLGGIGLIMAEYLARTLSARLVLTGRTGLPGREQWDPVLADAGAEKRLKEKIRKMKGLENLGSEVMVCEADVSDESRMKAVAKAAVDRFGAVDGIIHSAGIADGEMIQRRSRQVSERIFAAKLQGTLVLHRLFRKLQADFLILNSSMSAILPQIGQVGYCAANVFLDAFAAYADDTGASPVIAVDWDRWQSIGVALIAETRHRELTGARLEGGITPSEGCDAFGRILSNASARVVVSTHDLEMVIENYSKLEPQAFWQAAEISATGRTVGRRPDLDTEYAAPGSEMEKILCRIWAGFFGFEAVGVHDDFFELGGDSLKAMMVVSRIQQELGPEISLADFFKNATVERLARLIEGIGGGTCGTIPPVESREYYPLSSGQKRLYILQQLERDFVGYNETSAVMLEGDLDREKLLKTFREMIIRHHCLRTSFQLVDDEPVQRIHESVDFEIEFVDSRRQPSVADFVRPFDLSRPPLFRVGVLAAGEGKYILVTDIHHIIADGTSMRIFTRDFIALYRDQRLPRLKLQYKDFSRWQQGLEMDGTLEKQAGYWLSRFADEIPVLNLPTDFSRPPLQSFAGRSLDFELSTEETAFLKELTLKQGATLYMVLLAIYNILLARISGQYDIVVGVPVAGRRYPDLEPVIGMFVNTLPLRNSPRPEQTFAELLGELKQRTLEALENQDYPFETLVERLMKKIDRDMSRNPLFDVMFVFQNLAVSLGDGGEAEEFDMHLAPYSYENRISRFDLMLDGAEVGDRLIFKTNYCTRLFKETTIRRFNEYFKRTAASIIRNPRGKMTELELISHREKRQIVEDFNGTSVPYLADVSVLHRFESNVNRAPDCIALIDTGCRDQVGDRHDHFVTYAEFYRLSGQSARHLKGRGIRNGFLVGIKSHRSLAMMTGIFGTLMAGAAYLPVDPQYPEDRIRFMLTDSSAGIILTGEEIEGLENRPPLQPRGLSGGSPAYCIYTSGTTGRPKGVVINHHSLANRLYWMQEKYTLAPGDTVLQKTPFTFDVSVWEIFWWSQAGATLCLLEPGGEKDPGTIAAAILRQRVSVLHFVPSMLAVFLDYLEVHEYNTRFPCLNQVICSGESLPPVLVRRFNLSLSRGRAVRLANLYGPTEATIDVSYYDCPAVEEGPRVPIGRPIYNTGLFVIDNNFNLQPIGIPGELTISGVGLARGYLNRPELTAEKFVRRKQGLPLPPILYRTGDLARWLPEGDIDFLGRIDHQVKIRGFRIELAEIETRLSLHPQVRESVVTVRENEGADLILVAYMVMKSSGPDDVAADSEALHDYLSRTLPDYMIPSFFVPMDRLPLTSNGKVDRKALPEPDIKAGKGHVPPRNPVEENLAGIWAEVLGVRREVIGIDANFFRLGGHSLRATIMMSRIHRQMGVKLPLARIFKTPTIRGLAECISRTDRRDYSAVVPVEKKEYYPLSASQKRLYMLQQMEADTVVYNMPNVGIMEGEIDRNKLTGVLETLIRRHQSLRTCFLSVDKEIVQVIRDRVDFRIEYHQWMEAGMHRPDNLVMDFVRPYDLASAPLLRLGLIRLQETEHILMIDTHHIISDGTSQSLFIEEFITLYGGEDLTENSVHYRDYSEWQNGPAARESLRLQEAYWLKELAGERPVACLPADFKRPPVQSFEGGSLIFDIEAAESASLKRIALEEGVSLFVVLLAVYNVLILKLSGLEDVWIGTQVAGRRQAELQRVIGVFINTLVLRNYPRLDQTFCGLVQEIMARTMEAFENQDYQFEELAEKLLGKREAARNPLFDVMFVWQNMEFPEIEIPGLKLKPYPGGLKGKALIDLTLYGYEAGDRLSFLFEYSTELFKPETIQRFVVYFKEIVSAVAVDRYIKLGEISIAHHLGAASSILFSEQDRDFEF